MRLLSREDIWSVYSMQAALDDVARAFAVTSEGKAQAPLRTRINLDEDRTLLVMPAYSAEIEAATVKTIGLYPGNARRNLPTAPATTALLDAQTGEVVCILDGDTVTKIRTGASSGVAFRQLACSDVTKGLVVGTGGQAFTQVLAMVTALPGLDEIRVANPELAAAERFVAELTSWEPFRTTGFAGRLTPTSDATAAAAGVGAIVLVTSSNSPVLGAETIEPGCVISCVGSYQPHMQECGADVMQRADLIVCDSIEACVEESGDLIIPLRDGVIAPDDVSTEIGDIIAGRAPGRTDPHHVIVYETVGVGTQDLFTADAIYRAACASDVGMCWQPA